MSAPIKDYMTTEVHSVDPQQTLEQAFNLMKRNNIRHLPVLKSGEVEGFISERDFSLIDLYPDMSLKHSKVEDLMLMGVYQVTPETPLKDVVKNMAEQKYGATVITDSDNHLVGIFTTVDACRVLADKL